MASRSEETLAIAALPGPEFQALLSAVIREALGDLARAREGILAFLANPERGDHLQSVPALLNEVNGAMFMLPLDKVLPLLEGTSDYLRDSVAASERVPDEHEQNLLADVIAAMEYYLEAVEQGRGDMTHILARGERALAELMARRQEPAPAPAAEEKLAVVREIATPATDEAAPTPTPANPSSVIGVSTTRCSPNVSMRPRLTLYAPW